MRKYTAIIICIFLFLTACAKKEESEVKISKEVEKAQISVERELANITEKSIIEVEEPKSINTLDQDGNFSGFVVYLEKGYFKNHFIPSGWMGDVSDMRFNDGYKENVKVRNSCIQIQYRAMGPTGWAGIYWQNPENNWGNRQGGFDLAGANKLTFWARGEKGGEIIDEFKMGGITGLFPDSDTASIGPIVLEPEWKQYEIDLTDVDLSYIVGGFCWVAAAQNNPDGMTFYLDAIKYE